jgi:DNA-binding transcriptional ArsR family regulator
MIELTVLADPTGLFEPGERYAEADIANWLREHSVPEGLTLERNGQTCKVRRGQLVTLYNATRHIPTHQRPRTPTRLRLLRLLYELAECGDPSPTYREMQAALGLKSRGAIVWQLDKLERDGLIIRERYAWRGVWLSLQGIERAKEVTE